MNTPTPEEAREALDKLVVYANNGWGSACPGEVDTIRRFIDAHSAPVQPEPVANDVLRPALQQAILALEELDGPGYLIGGVMHYRIGLLLPKLNETLASLASHPPAQPAQAEPTAEMVRAYLDANDAYWRRVDELPSKIGVWRDGTPQEATLHSLRAAIAAQPKREPLTDEQIEVAMYGCLNDWDWREFARAIERLVLERKA